MLNTLGKSFRELNTQAVAAYTPMVADYILFYRELYEEDIEKIT